MLSSRRQIHCFAHAHSGLRAPVDPTIALGSGMLPGSAKDGLEACRTCSAQYPKEWLADRNLVVWLFARMISAPPASQLCSATFPKIHQSICLPAKSELGLDNSQ